MWLTRVLTHTNAHTAVLTAIPLDRLPSRTDTTRFLGFPPCSSLDSLGASVGVRAREIERGIEGEERREKRDMGHEILHKRKTAT